MPIRRTAKEYLERLHRNAAPTTDTRERIRKPTFRQKKTTDTQTEVGKFIVVSLIGAAMNVTIVYIVSTHITPLFGFSERLWLNVAKLTSTVFVFAWNFLGYKYWAFKKRA